MCDGSRRGGALPPVKPDIEPHRNHPAATSRHHPGMAVQVVRCRYRPADRAARDGTTSPAGTPRWDSAAMAQSIDASSAVGEALGGSARARTRQLAVTRGAPHVPGRLVIVGHVIRREMPPPRGAVDGGGAHRTASQLRPGRELAFTTETPLCLFPRGSHAGCPASAPA